MYLLLNHKQLLYKILPYGCQMNFNDSETIDSMMEKHDYVKTDLPEKADDGVEPE